MRGSTVNREKFRKWLEEGNFYSSAKQVSDCVSRVGRVDQMLLRKRGKDLDEQYEIDGCKEVYAAISRMGHAPELNNFLPWELPTGRQLTIIHSAFGKFLQFKKETSK